MVGHVDHGKSTLIGRLLADTDQTRLERAAKVQSLCESTGRKFEYAFLLDALEEEQTQGITIDVTEVNWRFKDKEYVFVDTPGHREFLKKMVGGASRVEAAVLLLDVSEGIKEAFRRQMMVLDLLGVKRRIIVVNKMDLADWREDAWLEREKEIRALLGPESGEVWIIPASAWHGANLLSRAEEMPWYQGGIFADALHAAASAPEEKAGPARFFIQDVYKFEEKKRIYVGRVESGEIYVGQELMFHPGHLSTRVTSIEVHGEKRLSARKGDAVGLTLADPLFLDRGALGFEPSHAPAVSSHLRGDLFWLDSTPIKKGDRLKIKMGTRSGFARVHDIEREIDGDTFMEKKSPEALRMFGRVVFHLEEEWSFDRFEDCEPTGRFVVSREGQVLGGGRWVDKAEAAAAGGKRVLWFAGLSGAGKTTLARALEAELKKKNEKVFVLDGDVLRRGLCSDLGFSDEDRRENIRRAAELAKLLAAEGFTVITAFISPRQEHRDLARAIVGNEAFAEIFIDCPLEVCEARDVKGLYKKARRGEIPDFTGIHSAFEAPLTADVHLSTAHESIETSIQQLLRAIGGTP
jgi:bifunctional enzyme CysN/CysC